MHFKSNLKTFPFFRKLYSNACTALENNYNLFNPRRHEEQKLREGMGGGGVNRTPPIYFQKYSIQPIEMKLGMCNKCPVYSQLSIVMWHLIGFHSNHSNIMMSLVAAILDFQIFKIFLYPNLNTENSEKTTFSNWNLQNYEINCKIVNI